MYSVGFLTLGCKVNAYETKGMEESFRAAGFEIRSFADQADVYVVNTCTVTNIADRKSRQMLHRAKKRNPRAVVVAAGCYAQAKACAAEEDGIDLIVGNNQKSQIVSMVLSYLEQQREEAGAKQRVQVLERGELGEYEELLVTNTGNKNRAFIKIQDGCNQFCSYCIIPYVRGEIRSRKEEDVLREVKELADKGCREIVLTGIHLSSYGAGSAPEQHFLRLQGEPLLSLIEKISGIGGIQRIRLGSLEPRIVTESFARRLSMNSKVCPHFHLSLQSGCDATLQRMNRKYTVQEYRQGAAYLRKYFDRPALTTDLIVGFPCETVEEFETTRAFAEEMEFADVHIFKYSRRKGTRADRMEGQIPEDSKAERSRILIEQGRISQEKYEKQLLGAEETLIIEAEETLLGQSYWSGRTSRYLKAAIPKENGKDLTNRMLTVVLEKRLGNGILLAAKK